MALCSVPRLLPDGTHCLLQTNPPHLDLAEDLATLLNLNECSALNTLQHRYHSHLSYTYAGPSLVAIRPGPTAGNHAGKVRGWAWDPSRCPGVRGSVLGGGHRTTEPTSGQSGGAGRCGPAGGTVGSPQCAAGDALRDARCWGCCWVMLRNGDARSWALLPAKKFSRFLGENHCIAVPAPGALGPGQEQAGQQCLGSTGILRAFLQHSPV